jgi:hypothetical protein
LKSAFIDPNSEIENTSCIGRVHFLIDRGICWSSLRRVTNAKSTTMESWAPFLETRRDCYCRFRRKIPSSPLGLPAFVTMLTAVLPRVMRG